MAVSLQSITNAIKNNYGKYLAKTAGAAAIGMVAYDAHIYGKLKADTYARSREAEGSGSAFNRTMYQTEPSVIQGKLKKMIFNLEIENNIGDLWNSAVGYIGGLTEMLVSGVVPLGLGLTALLTKSGKICKGAGVILAGYGGLKFVRDIFGVNENDPLNPTFK